MNLNWTTNKKNLLNKRLNSSSKTVHGVSCMFFKLTKNTGAKIYISKDTRDYSYELQKFASQQNLGPKCGSRFSIRSRKSLKKLEAKMVKIANSYGDVAIDHEIFMKMAQVNVVYGYITQVAKTNIRARRKELATLMSDLEDIDISCWDIDRSHNIGRINKKLVMIDFDPVSQCEYTFDYGVEPIWSRCPYDLERQAARLGNLSSI